MPTPYSFVPTCDLRYWVYDDRELIGKTSNTKVAESYADIGLAVLDKETGKFLVPALDS